MVVPSAAALFVMCLHIVADVASRWLANEPLAGTLEITAFWWMPTLVFLALAITQSRNEHLRATLLVDGLSEKYKRYAEALTSAVAIVLLAIMLYYAALGAADSTAIREAKLGVVTVPVWPFRWVAVIGLITLILQTFASLFRSMTDTDLTATEPVTALAENE